MSRVWLITGTSSGFGRAIAEEVLARGERVIATARDPRTLADLVARAPDRVRALELDVTRSIAVADAIAAFGGVDVLVNNAGFSIVGALEETSEAELRLTMETMFFGPVALIRALLPHLRERKGGTIVNITSVGGITTAPGFGAYCAAKHALEAVSESLAAELAPFGIRVLIVEPGAFRTALFGSGFHTMPVLPGYESTVGPTRGYVQSQAGKQAGDPAKAAAAIVAQVHAGAAPLRLPLGADATEWIRGKLAQVGSDVEATAAIAAATAFAD
jgi:NAD(P)-dependent dehydrogenase (short-subunit alcohol dehydrogenase family)